MRKLIPTGLTYCKVGGPPVNWQELLVLETKTRRVMNGLVEVNIEKGWVRRYAECLPETLVFDDWPIIEEYGDFVIMRIADVEPQEPEVTNGTVS